MFAEIAGLPIRVVGAKRPRDMTPTAQRGKDPSLYFDRLRYRRTHDVVDGRGRTICWCWSTVRNEDGEFIAWREVRRGDWGFRDQFRGRKARWRVKDWALGQYNAHPGARFQYRLKKGDKP